MTREPRTLIVLVLLLFAQCSDPAEPGEPCAFPDIGTQSWELVDRPGFTFRLPPGFVDTGVQPVDSDAAVFRFEDTETTLAFDFGAFSRPLDDVDCTTEIDGRTARLVQRTEDGVMSVAARWPELGSMGPNQITLLMTGTTDDAELFAWMLAAIASVEIK